MADHSSSYIPPPLDWQAFERNSRVLFQYILGDPAVQNNGTSGQRQHGVDIYGRRGGTGALVGVQCKGKSGNYGNAVTEKELREEIKKTEEFQPPLNEFILITTARDDAKIQKTARLLEQEISSKRRNLSVQVWGWGRLQHEIAQHGAALRVFHPDATPFTDQILDEQRETRRLVEQTHGSTTTEVAALAQQLARLESRLPTIVAETTPAAGALDRELNSQVDGYRDLLRGDRPKTALDLLLKLKERVGQSASSYIRYRILANIGAAYYNLGEYDASADYLLEAAPLHPDDPGSLANKIAGLLIKKRKDEAHSLAVTALAAHPDNLVIAQQRLQALAPGETTENVWAQLSAAARTNPTAHAIRISALRDAGDGDWRRVASEAATEYPNDEGILIIKAEGTVEAFQKADPGAVGLDSGAGPSQADLTDAADVLEKAWRDSLGKETPAKAPCAHNAALARSLLGDFKKAAELLDAALATGFDTDQTRHNRIMLYRRMGETDEARRMADTLPDLPLNRIIRADLRTETDPVAARDILSNRDSFTHVTDVVAATLIVAEAYCHERKFAEAEAEVNRFRERLPDHPQGPLGIFRVKSARGDADAAAALDDALGLITDTIDFPTRFLVAEALGSVGRYDDVVGLLEGRTSCRVDTPALRSLIGAAVNADRRTLARRLFDEIPAGVAERPFFRKARVALELRAGNIYAAEQAIRVFLAGDPNNLELHLQLLLILYRQDKLKELRKEAAKPASQFVGEPEDLMKLAQFKDDFADWQEAHALGYRTLLQNQASQSVTMGYVALFLRPGHSQNMQLNPPFVESDMAVGLEHADKTKAFFVIESDPALRPSLQYLAPSHKVAQLLMGKAPGDEIILPDGTRSRIGWIKPKYLHALHDILENFPNRFPELRGLERITIDNSQPNPLEPMLQKVRDRHDAIQEINKLYQAGTLPLALAARATGCDTIEAMVGIASFGHSIRSCEGGHSERLMAIRAIVGNGAKGCIVDLATLHIIRRLELEAAVIATCGPIGIVESTAQRYQDRIRELQQALDRPDMSLSYRDGQYYRTERTLEEKTKALDIAYDDRDWLAANTVVIPAVGTRDPGATWRPLMDRFGSGFLDELRAAQGSGRLLLCEDQLLRQLAFLDFQVPGTWLQPVLMVALNKRVITPEQYLRAIGHLIDARIEFISVSTDLLVSAMRDAQGAAFPPAFEKVASRLGGKRADLPSHVPVAVNAVLQIWGDESLFWNTRQAALGRLLECLTRERSADEITEIVGAFVENDRWHGGDMSIVRYIAGWLQGHFIRLG